MPQTLWTPDRDVILDRTERAVKAIDAREMKVIEAMHVIAQKHRIVLACEQCRQPFQGYNSGIGQTQAIACGCRELRATVRASALITTA